MTYRKTWEVAYQRDRAAGRARYVPVEPTRSRLGELAGAAVPMRLQAAAADARRQAPTISGGPTLLPFGRVASVCREYHRPRETPSLFTLSWTPG